jgi:hypothetical protein
MSRYLYLLFLSSILICCNRKTKNSVNEKKQNCNQELEARIELWSHSGIDATFSKISSGQIGNIKVGDKLEIVLENLSKKFLIEKDSVEACPGCKEYLDIYYISNPQTHSLLFSLEPQSDSINGSKIFRMVTSNSAFKTENGIAVGVTLKELKYNYKIVDIVADGETGLHILVKGFKGSFGVEWPNNIEIDNINLQTLSDSLKINEIIIM